MTGVQTCALPISGRCSDFEELADEVICLTTPRSFMGVGGSYRDFSQTTNEEVRDLLERANERIEA
mgnify:CR=1 FL=1